MGRDREDTGGKEEALPPTGANQHRLRKSVPTSASSHSLHGRCTWEVFNPARGPRALYQPPFTAAAHTDLSHRHAPFAALRLRHHRAARLSARPCSPTRMI